MITFSTQAQVKSGTYNLMLKTLLKHSVPEISIETLTDNYGGTKTKYVLLDAREKSEYDVSHIPGAFWVGYDDFNMQRIPTIDSNTTIVVYCSVGYRSEKIAEKLLAKNYKNVHNLYGGIFEYVNDGNKVINNQAIETDSIHGYSKAWGIWLNKGQKVYND